MNYRALGALGISVALFSVHARAQDDETETEESAKAGNTTKAGGATAGQASAGTSTKVEAEASAKVPAPSAPAAETSTATAEGGAAERPPLYGKRGDWNITPYGYARLDAIEDSTQSFEDGIQPNLIARVGTYRGDHRRSIFTARD